MTLNQVFGAFFHPEVKANRLESDTCIHYLLLASLPSKRAVKMAEVIGEVQGEDFSSIVLTLWFTQFNLQYECFHQTM
jgi:hypothetical protein